MKVDMYGLMDAAHDAAVAAHAELSRDAWWWD